MTTIPDTFDRLVKIAGLSPYQFVISRRPSDGAIGAVEFDALPDDEHRFCCDAERAVSIRLLKEEHGWQVEASFYLIDPDPENFPTALNEVMLDLVERLALALEAMKSHPA